MYEQLPVKSQQYSKSAATGTFLAISRQLLVYSCASTTADAFLAMSQQLLEHSGQCVSSF